MISVIALTCLRNRLRCMLSRSSFLAYVGSIVVIACNERFRLAHSARVGVTTLALHIGQSVLRLANAEGALHIKVVDGQSRSLVFLCPQYFPPCSCAVFSSPSPKGAN